jgi:hypothetical protein
MEGFDPYQLVLFKLYEDGETDETIYSRFLLTRGERSETPFTIHNDDMQHWWFFLTVGYEMRYIRIYQYIPFDTFSLCALFINPKPLIDVIGRHRFHHTRYDPSKDFSEELIRPIVLHDGPDGECQYDESPKRILRL